MKNAKTFHESIKKLSANLRKKKRIESVALQKIKKFKKKTDMTPLETLIEEINKTLNACTDCGGVGQVENKNNRIDSNGLSVAVDCTTCKGDGYVIQLEFGCFVKPLTLQDILLVFDENKVRWESTWEKTIEITQEATMGCGCCHEDEVTLTLDLTKLPQEWDDKTVEAVIELIK